MEALFLAIGSAFFGAGIQGFVTELSNSRPVWLTVYVVLAFGGMVLLSWGIILMVRKR